MQKYLVAAELEILILPIYANMHIHLHDSIIHHPCNYWMWYHMHAQMFNKDVTP